MRISIRQDDPGYTQTPQHWEIWLDGEKLERCITADEALGMVLLPDPQARKLGADMARPQVRTGRVEVKYIGPHGMRGVAGGQDQ